MAMGKKITIQPPRQPYLSWKDDKSMQKAFRGEWEELILAVGEDGLQLKRGEDVLTQISRDADSYETTIAVLEALKINYEEE